MKIKIFKKENNFKKRNFVFNINLYWKFVVCAGFVLILLSFFFGFRLFMQVNQEPLLPATNKSGQVPTVSKDRLEKVLNYFSDREQKSLDILNFYAPVVDPAL